MYKIAILGSLQQHAEALATQFQPVYALYNENRHICNLSERQSSERIVYISYRAVGLRQETAELLKQIKNISPDIIYINSLKLLLTIGLYLRISHAFRRRPILIATSRNSAVWQRFSKRILISVLLNVFADGIFTLAKFQTNWLIRYGVSESKIRTIYNPVDTDKFSPSVDRSQGDESDGPVIINVADLRPIKRQDRLIKVVEQVKKVYPNVKLIFMGGRFSDSEYGQYLAGLIDEYQVKGNVINIGDIEHEKIPSLLRSADISILSSKSEVCPSAILESLATGKVTIASSVGGIPDLIDHEVNGFLVDAEDINGYADYIIKVQRDKNLRMMIEKNARNSAISNYSYQVIGEKHKDFISALIN